MKRSAANQAAANRPRSPFKSGTNGSADYLPYGRQTIDEEDIEAVVKVLRSDWLTTGPAIEEFERAFATYTGARHAVAVSSGTAALHAAIHALGVAPGDEVIVPAITFAATSNAVVFCGGVPVFADVKPGSLLLDAARAEEKITSKTRAIVSVDYAGQPCDYAELVTLARRHNLTLVADACHAIGAEYQSGKVGTLADLNTFSFHPVKHITTGEGGMVTTHDSALAARMRNFRNHGITSDHRQRTEAGAFYYEMVELGFNYRISDFQCALGVSQLRKLPAWLERRRQIAAAYDQRLQYLSGMQPLDTLTDRTHAYHLYVVRIDSKSGLPSRGEVFSHLRENGIGCNVHYLPVYLHPFYRNRFGLGQGLCTAAEAAYEEILSLPIYPQMNDCDVDRVVATLESALANGKAG
jgi:perosamine synthetase